MTVAPHPLSLDEARRYRTRVSLLGTSGGPPIWENTDRSGISTAIMVEGRVYLIDCGMGWAPRYREAGLGPSGFQKGFDQLRAVFITHHHSDHTVDYPNLLLLAWHNGSDGLEQPIRVLGPGDRGMIPPIFRPEDRAELPEVFAPDKPTPGLVDSTDLLLRAYATDINDRTHDNAKRKLSEIFTFEDITLPGTTGASPNDDPTPDMEPFEVYQDDLVRVTAILVDHRPIFPAFAFRFETPDGSIVISGDTGVCRNLVRIAEGADILLHECIDMDWVDQLMGPGAPKPDENLMQHMLAAHTSIEQVGPQAQAAGVRTLVLTHLVPGFAPKEKWLKAQNGFDGNLVVGEDLMHFGLGTPRDSDA